MRDSDVVTTVSILFFLFSATRPTAHTFTASTALPPFMGHPKYHQDYGLEVRIRKWYMHLKFICVLAPNPPGILIIGFQQVTTFLLNLTPFIRFQIWACIRFVILPAKCRSWNSKSMCHAGSHHAGVLSRSRPRGTKTLVVITIALRHKAGNATGSSLFLGSSRGGASVNGDSHRANRGDAHRESSQGW